MKKGSPRDYDAETGCFEQPAQKSQLGEAHDCYPLYRIGRTQENHQLLHKDGSRPNRSAGQIGGIALSASKLGRRPAGAVVWGHGSDPVQCLDLRHTETLCRETGDGPSRQDEGHHRGQEEKRCHRCKYHRRSTPLRLIAHLLCVAAGAARSAPFATVPPSGGTRIGAHAKQDGWSAEGERSPLRQRQITRQEILHRAGEKLAGSTGVGQGSTADEPQLDGNVSGHPEAIGGKTAVGTCLGAARRTTDEYPRRRSDYGSDLGVGDRRPASLCLHRRCRQLLRLNGSLPLFCRQATTWSDFQAAQRLAAVGVDRSRQTGAPLEPATGRLACPRIRTRTCQSRDLAGGAQAGGLPAGCGQEWPALSGTHSASACKHEGGKQDQEKEQKGSCVATSRLRANTPRISIFTFSVRVVKTEHAVSSFLRHADLSPDGHSRLLNTKGNLASQIPLRTHRWDESDRVFLAGCSSAEPASASSIHSAYQNSYVRSVSDPLAGPCVCRDCVREFRLPIHPIRCFKVGRFTQTQSSWTVSRYCSRKWMSGRAAIALVLLRDRGQFGSLSIYSPGEPSLPGHGESPFPLDFYLSWTSLRDSMRSLCLPRTSCGAWSFYI